MFPKINKFTSLGNRQQTPFSYISYHNRRNLFCRRKNRRKASDYQSTFPDMGSVLLLCRIVVRPESEIHLSCDVDRNHIVGILVPDISCFSECIDNLCSGIFVNLKPLTNLLVRGIFVYPYLSPRCPQPLRNQAEQSYVCLQRKKAFSPY